MPRDTARFLLVSTELFVAVTAIAGGICLLTGTIDPGQELLAGSAFHNYRVPGLVLAAVVGGSALVAGVTVLRRSRHSALLTVLAGVFMGHWIVTEWATVGYHWLQLPYLVIGVAIAIAGWRLHDSDLREQPHRDRAA